MRPVGVGSVGCVKRVAAIDCGTNSIRLLIADIDLSPEGRVTLKDLVREMRIVRLGQGVDQTGRLADDAIERTLKASNDYRDLIAEYGAQAVRFVATSAMRDASNGERVMTAVRQAMGVTPEVIPGEEEAYLSFTGATWSLGRQRELPSLVVDIGGGSTEFVLGGVEVEQSISINMGSVRVTERFGLRPGDEAAKAAADAWIDTQLDRVEQVVDLSVVGSVVGVAGTVTTLAAQALDLQEYDPEATHGKLLTWRQWEDSAAFMMDESVERKAALGFMPPGRADVIGAGALIWERVLSRVRVRTEASGRELEGAFVSEHDILDGIALSLAGSSA